MHNLFELAIHALLTLLKLSKPGGAKALLAENMAMRQQLVIVGRQRQRVAKLTASDRFIFGVLAGLIAPPRLRKIAVVIKPATLLKFHKALVQRKYRRLYSNKSNRRAGRKGPTQEMIDLVVSIKQKNTRYGYRRIATQI